MNFNYQVLSFWWSVVQTIFTVLLAIYVWIVRRSSVNTTRIRAVEKELTEKLDNCTRATNKLEKRLIRAEEAQRFAPTQENLKALHSRLDGIGRELATLSGSVTEQKGTLAMIHEFMLNRSKGE